jgi:hypothetical protein
MLTLGAAMFWAVIILWAVACICYALKNIANAIRELKK